MLEKLAKAAKICKTVTMDKGARKYSLFFVCLGALAAGFAIGGALPAVAAQYSVFVGGVLGLYGLYCSGNVAAKWSPIAKEELKISSKDAPGPQG